MPGWPKPPAAHLVWARGGAGRKEVQELRLLELEGALENPGAPGWREKQPREGGHGPRPHSTEEANTPMPVPPSWSWGQLCPLKSQACPGFTHQGPGL